MVTINGKTLDLPEETTVSDYLEDHLFKPVQIAVELNDEILPKSLYDETVLKDGDVVEIVQFMGGG